MLNPETNSYMIQFILYARSEYFRALISSEMKESKDGEIHIEEFSYDAMLETMRYLYTGRCEFTPVCQTISIYPRDSSDPSKLPFKSWKLD